MCPWTEIYHRLAGQPKEEHLYRQLNPIYSLKQWCFKEYLKWIWLYNMTISCYFATPLLPYCTHGNIDYILVQDLEKEISQLQREVEMLQLRKPRMKIQDIIQDNDKVQVYITILICCFPVHLRKSTSK